MKSNNEMAQEAIVADCEETQRILFMKGAYTPDDLIRVAMIRDERWVREGRKS